MAKILEFKPMEIRRRDDRLPPREEVEGGMVVVAWALLATALVIGFAAGVLVMMLWQ